MATVVLAVTGTLTAVAVPASATETAYLDALYWTQSSTGWGYVHLNRSVDGNPIRVGTTDYVHGIGTHSDSTIIYALGGAASRFRAVVGLDGYDENVTAGSVRFKVYADQTAVFDSGTMTRTSAPRTVDVDVSGASALRLVVTDAGDGNTWDHADWADAKLTVGSVAALPSSAAPNTVLGQVDDPSGVAYDSSVSSYPQRPYIRDYSQIPFTKLYLAGKSPTNPSGATVVNLTFEQALAQIKRLDNLMLGAEKIVYLVGWQYEGHDSKYPAWGEVNAALKRPQDATAVDSLRWLMAEAKKYNTIVSLHINMLDAYADSPLWADYVAADIIGKDINGVLIPGEVWGGQTSYQLSYKQEWVTGRAKDRIDALLALLPIADAGTIHIDSFISVSPSHPFEPISPYLGYTTADEQAAQRTILRYWRNKGVDVTTEYDRQDVRKEDGFTGLEATSWHVSGTYPPALRAVTPLVSVEGDVQTGSWDAITHTLTASFPAWYYGNNTSRVIGHEPHDDGSGNTFYPALWRDRTVVATSASGYSSKTWTLPPGWAGVASAALYRVTPDGRTLREVVPVIAGAVSFGLTAGEVIAVMPYGVSSAAAPIGQTIAFSAPDGRYAVAWANQTGSPLKANSPSIGSWERFTVVSAGDGYVALKAVSNGKYVVSRADVAGAPLQADSAVVGAWERFAWESSGSGVVMLRSLATGAYVRAFADEADSPLRSVANETPTVFHWVAAP